MLASELNKQIDQIDSFFWKDGFFKNSSCLSLRAHATILRTLLESTAELIG